MVSVHSCKQVPLQLQDLAKRASCRHNKKRKALDQRQAMLGTPPSKKARQHDGSGASPSSFVGLNITRLEDIVPDNRTMYNVMCRMIFISLGGFSEQGEYMISAELIDGSTVFPMKVVVLGRHNVAAVRQLNVDDVVKIRNISATELGGEVALFAEASRGLGITSMNARAPECRAIPQAPNPMIMSISRALQEEVPTANFFVRVRRILQNAMLVTDHTGFDGSVYLHHQVRACPFTPNMLLCLHRVVLENGSAFLRPSGAVEEITQEVFEEESRRNTRPPSPTETEQDD